MITPTDFVKRYIKKIYNLLLFKFFYKKKLLLSNLYLFNVDTVYLSRVKKILFFLNDPILVHLGDHLFFMPLILALKDAGYQVTLAPTKPMKEFFKILNVDVITDDINFKDYDLLISLTSFSSKLKNEKAVLVNTAMNLRMPICDQMLVDFQKILGRPEKLNFTRPTFDNFVGDTLNLENNGKAIMFSPYINSTFYMKTKNKLNKLLNYVEKCSNDGYVILLMGSQEDKLTDKNHYSFPVHDLRGKVTIPQLVSIAKLPNIHYFVGFDTFIMQLFTLLKKPSYVVFRGRLRKKQHEMVKKYAANLFKDQQYVTFL